MDIYIYLPIFTKLQYIFFLWAGSNFPNFSYYTYARALNFIGVNSFLPTLDNHC